MNMNFLKDWSQILNSAASTQPQSINEVADAEYESMMIENKAKFAEQASKQREYLISRGKCIMTNDATYRNAASTDVRLTMKEYVETKIPHMKEAYGFLFS